MDIPPLSVSHRAFGNRAWRCVFFSLLLLECAQLWVFQYSPSTDGPSHLMNASVVANYGIEKIYQQYYTITLVQPAGNMLTQVLLVALLKLAGPVMAEKLLLSIYIVLFFSSFYYFLRALTPDADYFACFAGILCPNFFFYMGFWNFLYSVGFALFTLGYYLRQRQRWTLRSLALLMLAGFVVYMTHPVSWLVCLVAVAILGLPSAIPWSRGYPLFSQVQITRKTMTEYAKPICSLLPPGVLLMYWTRMQGEPVHAADYPSVGERLHSLDSLSFLQLVLRRLEPLYSLSFLHSFTVSEWKLAEAVACAFFIALLFVGGLAYWRRQYNLWSTPILLLTLMCAAIAIGGPNNVGTGSYIRLRVALYASMFLLAWLAAALHSWPRLPLNMIAALFSCIAVIGVAVRLPVLSNWNERLSAFAVIGQHIHPGSTILHLNLEYPEPITPENPHGVNPYLHAVGLLSARAIVDLRNYEASETYFSTKFRPDMSPVPALGTLDQMESARPVFDVARYEKETRGRVDYLLFQGGAVADGNRVQFLEDTVYRIQIAAFTFVASAQPGNLRLYQRVPGINPLN
jgi:hypothetical protein